MSEEPFQDESVTDWLEALRAEQSHAGPRIWDRYLTRLIALASLKLGQSRKRVIDEEDIVSEVFRDFLQGVSQDRFDRLNDRHDLWQILAMLTERKVIGHLRREGAVKRGKSRTRGESVFENKADGDRGGRGWQAIAGRDPDPAISAELADTLAHLLSVLDEPALQSLARDQLSGYSQQEMAQRHGISIPTVQRKLRLIRRKWERTISDAPT
ncbi:MAG: hypothetical protein KDB22_15425 [Planctomycetales bacterium]|nr:hypothetical protein [Planctomycetales bacterium]